MWTEGNREYCINWFRNFDEEEGEIEAIALIRDEILISIDKATTIDW
jgi:hypothetical protein